MDCWKLENHLDALFPHFTAHKVALVFFYIVYKLHGMPRSIVSDRDPLFIRKLWCELFLLCVTKLRMSTTYHPETGGQIEVFNRVFEQYLHSFLCITNLPNGLVTFHFLNCHTTHNYTLPLTLHHIKSPLTKNHLLSLTTFETNPQLKL